MKILIASDSFKDSLPAKQVAESLKSGIQRIFMNATFELLPVADGGEGTVESIIDSTRGEMIRMKVHDPLLRVVDSFFGITGDGKTAVIEMAAASGIELLGKQERNPWITSTCRNGRID